MKDNINQQSLDVIKAALSGQTLMYTKCDMCGTPVIKYSDYIVEGIPDAKRVTFKLMCQNPECEAVAECVEVWKNNKA